MRGSFFRSANWLTVTALAGLTCGCAYPGNPGEIDEVGTAGDVRLPLLAETETTTHRLRNALFDVTGPTVTTLDSETDPDATELTATLAAGTYEIWLRDGWVLERLDEAGRSIVQAELASSNPHSFEVPANATTDLSFRFVASGEIVELGRAATSHVGKARSRSRP